MKLGEMPLTLFLVVAGIVLYLYIRRANLGIDQHPQEGGSAPRPGRPMVRVGYGAIPILPPVGGLLSPEGR